MAIEIISGQIVDIHNKRIFPGEIRIENGLILSIKEVEEAAEVFIMPGFVDSHVHIESSMLVPSEFARLAVVHGTVATVSDPHEIGNVLGIKGVRFMVENGLKVPLKFNFGAPSCVPATNFESAGAVMSPEEIEFLMKDEEIRYLAEMMNYPGVLFEDPVVMEKIAIAAKYGKPVDGHAPGLRGEDAKKYIQAGISTDHECYSYEEGLEKLKYGMKVIIREGSAAKNFEALIPLLDNHYEMMMFCSDDKHPDDLIIGHINQLAARAIEKGNDLFKVLQVACVNPVSHYKLPVGLLREGDPADLILVKDLRNFEAIKTYIDGNLVAEHGKALFNAVDVEIINNFHASPKRTEEFRLPAKSENIRVIHALDGELITKEFLAEAKINQGLAVSNPGKDILKIAVINRYKDVPPAIAFIKGFGLKQGAIASCVGHDSHNIIAVGTDDESLTKAVNLIIKNMGGISAVGNGKEMALALPIAGIMTKEDGYVVGKKYAEIDKFAKSLGSSLRAPFMTLSFMALLVIPELKLSDLGLFDGKTFQFTSVFTGK